MKIFTCRTFESLPLSVGYRIGLEFFVACLKLPVLFLIFISIVHILQACGGPQPQEQVGRILASVGGLEGLQASSGGPAELRASSNGLVELRASGGGPTELRALGGGLVELKASSYCPAELRASGSGPVELRASGGGPVELRALSGGPVELMASGGGLAELRALDGGPVELRYISTYKLCIYCCYCYTSYLDVPTAASSLFPNVFHFKIINCTQIGGSLRGRGWKYGSGFVDGVFPVLSPMAQQILEYVRKEVDADKIWASLDSLPPTHNLWDDLVNVAVQLRFIKQWDPIISNVIYHTQVGDKACLYKLLSRTGNICYAHCTAAALGQNVRVCYTVDH
ncbi:hypothetical protein IEQ34_018830 [Dendrobium chrysotoxum]|uniref:Uncharacterized protein n=1 Tax=Dendrobium chrysotoxum TaxID=161865 RepID=A0AAV7G543_DENCH|nr:hypothetical protein IEQ34_018830 [Dendrobium chrysotoxum]